MLAARDRVGTSAPDLTWLFPSKRNLQALPTFAVLALTHISGTTRLRPGWEPAPRLVIYSPGTLTESV
jgi:hypothetical protein